MSTSNPEATPGTDGYDVFVSHSSKDKAQADAVVRRLERTGTRCWIAPRDIMPGSDYGEAIINGIEGCKVMVLVFSGHANESPQIAREVERAVHNRVQIVPFRIENIAPKKSLEYFISSPHWLDAFSGSFDANLDYLAQTIDHLLLKTKSTPKAPENKTQKLKDTWRKLTKRYGAPKVIGGALVALALLAWGIKFALTPPIVDPAFRGKWQATIPNSGVVVNPTVAKDGSFSNDSVVEEGGRIDIRNTLVYLVQNSGSERLITWQPIDQETARSSLAPNLFWQVMSSTGNPDVMSRVAVLAQKAIWKRSLDPKRPGIAIWTFDPEIPNQKWNVTFETGPGPNYRFRAVLSETGQFRAREGKWTLVLSSNVPISGTYEVLSENQINVGSIYGQAVWRRQK